MLGRGEALEAARIIAFGPASNVEVLSHRTGVFENPSDLEGSSGNLGHWCLWKTKLRREQGS